MPSPTFICKFFSIISGSLPFTDTYINPCQNSLPIRRATHQKYFVITIYIDKYMYIFYVLLQFYVVIV